MNFTDKIADVLQTLQFIMQLFLLNVKVVMGLFDFFHTKYREVLKINMKYVLSILNFPWKISFQIVVIDGICSTVPDSLKQQKQEEIFVLF